MSTDSKILRFIHDRMQYVYGENPNRDYMLNLLRMAEEKEACEAKRDAKDCHLGTSVVGYPCQDDQPAAREDKGVCRCVREFPCDRHTQ